MVPAQQRFKTDNLLAGHIHQGLIPYFQPLLLLECDAQIGGDLLTRLHRFIHRARKQAILAAPFVFRFVERDIRLAHQLLTIQTVLRRDRDANADADPGFAAKQNIRLSQRIDNPLTQPVDLIYLRNIFQYDNKFIAADASDGIAFA